MRYCHRLMQKRQNLNLRGANDLNARKKLNSNTIAGSLIVAAIIGALAQSWWVFGATTVVLLGLALHDGGIRPKPTTRKRVN